MTRLGFAFALLASSLLGCSSTTVMTPDSSVPFAQGEVDASFEDNGNNSFTLSVKHLGDPAKLASAATTYVVWIVPKKDEEKPQNIGALKVDDDYNGELEFKTPHKAFAILVTPETAADVTAPSGRNVLSGEIDGD